MSLIQFHSDNNIKVLRLSKDGVWANPDIPADEAAKLVLVALDINIKALIDKAVKAEREACAKVCEEMRTYVGRNNAVTQSSAKDCASAIRARSNT